jgi:hypothetical protein
MSSSAASASAEEAYLSVKRTSVSVQYDLMSRASRPCRPVLQATLVIRRPRAYGQLGDLDDERDARSRAVRPPLGDCPALLAGSSACRP